MADDVLVRDADTTGQDERLAGQPVVGRDERAGLLAGEGSDGDIRAADLRAGAEGLGRAVREGRRGPRAEGRLGRGG